MARASDHFRQACYAALPTSRGTDGQPVLGTRALVMARVQPSRAFVRDGAGNSVQARYVVYTLTALTLAHRVWLPGIDTTNAALSLRILAVDQLVDGNGVEGFRKVWLV